MFDDYPPVLTKKDFVERYLAGEFGNRAPSWATLDEFRAGDYRGKAHLRNRVAGGETYYNIEAADISALWEKQERPELWYCSGMAPHDLNLLQGEVVQSHNQAGLDLYYSDVIGKPMRDALAERSYQVHGVRSSLVLREYLDANSYDWLMELLQRYPYHVVEISVFSKPWGTLFPLFNTVVWEVRSY